MQCNDGGHIVRVSQIRLRSDSLAATTAGLIGPTHVWIHAWVVGCLSSVYWVLVVSCALPCWFGVEEQRTRIRSGLTRVRRRTPSVLTCFVPRLYFHMLPLTLVGTAHNTCLCCGQTSPSGVVVADCSLAPAMSYGTCMHNRRKRVMLPASYFLSVCVSYGVFRKNNPSSIIIPPLFSLCHVLFFFSHFFSFCREWKARYKISILMAARESRRFTIILTTSYRAPSVHMV